MKIIRCILFSTILLLSNCNSLIYNPNDIYININQIGFTPRDFKSAVVISKNPLFNKTFYIKDLNNNIIIEKPILDSLISPDRALYSYNIEFSELSKNGSYYIEVDGKKSNIYSISPNIYNQVVDSLMLFLQVQRCGPTNPLLHPACHLSDATHVANEINKQQIDATGGWHDAADYIKFFSTTAYTTYMLLFSYEFDPIKFGFDNNKNNVPDILEEAKVGIDWLLRCSSNNKNFITQVQDNRDHYGWRLPQNDSLQFDRPAYIDISKNLIGLYSGTLSLASRIWKNKFYEDEFASKLLEKAQLYYSLKNESKNLDKNISGVYQDHSHWSKLELGAIELYNTTRNKEYLSDAIKYADSAKSDFWWSYGDLNSLAHFKLAKHVPRFTEYIYQNLLHFNLNTIKSQYGEALNYTWGTTNYLLGISLQEILYYSLTSDNSFDTLSIYQRDYVLGRNKYGLSFIYGVGKKFPKYLHSQIAYFSNGYIPGAVSAGPAPDSLLKKYKIDRTNNNYELFNTDSIKYFDDYADYITNEPTIITNATAIFVYGYYSER